MRKIQFVAALIAVLAGSALAAPPAPRGPHPRIWLDAPTLTALQALRADANSAVSLAFTRCAAARARPAMYAPSGYQGFDWAAMLTNCALAWQVRGDPADAATALVYFNALLDDYRTVGDGAGGDNVVQHDTGYAMRTFGPYSALAYDWLHDAPGVAEPLRAHARARFKVWSSWYAQSGYLKDEPGSNYQAGWVLAATLMAIAEGGEAGADGDTLWTLAVDRLFGMDLASGLQPGGDLVGGDWPEGWQYGPLSVLEYAMAARALEQQGVPLPVMDKWAEQLVTHHVHALQPSRTGLYVGGDTQGASHNVAPNARTLLGVIAGPATGEPARSLARSEIARLKLTDPDFPMYQALAQARDGAATPLAPSEPTLYVAQGTRTLFARGSWDVSAPWGVFQCAPRLVADHQHTDAGNWVLSRGADDLVVDPTPYGSLSTLSSNAPAIDSNVLPASYRPSQAVWGNATSLAWVKQTPSGLVAARGEYHDQFRLQQNPADVTTALRDWLFLPGGGDVTVVLVDRVQTADARRGAHLRLRTPAKLVLAGGVASGVVGGSMLSVRVVRSTGAGPIVNTPMVGDDCSPFDRGKCALARFPVSELALDLPGPNADATVVIDGSAAGVAAPGADTLSGPGYRGVVLTRRDRLAVITTDTPDAKPPAQMIYHVPAGRSALHVVLDAPQSAGGRSEVSARVDGSDCEVTVRPAMGASGIDARPLVLRLSDSCVVREDMAQVVMPMPDAGVGMVDAAAPPADAAGNRPGDAANSSSDGGVAPVLTANGCGCTVGGAGGSSPHVPPFALLVVVTLALLALRRSLALG